ncbi:MAG: NADH-quinone oxidoreductase subunit N, partial [Planctomycetaceae bacterium]|nr:NADH-quinone oxidoreductase subunit N [Planctomycetaceae bacterium]
RSLWLAGPELALTAGIVLLLLGRLLGFDKLIPPHWIALAGAMAAFGLSLAIFYSANSTDPTAADEYFGVYFSGLMTFDKFGALVRLFLLLFLVFVLALTVLSGIPDAEDGPDFYTLLLGAVVGMLLMCSANNLLMVFLGIEMASVPSYAMAGFLKGRKQGSEAALKFVVFGAGAAGVMLYGISLLAGMLGTGDFQEIGLRLTVLFGNADGTLSDPVRAATIRTLLLALVMIFVGFAFKLSIVPFHFWTPDVFQGAPAEVGGFLSVASKAAAFALLTRLVLAIMSAGTASLQDLYLILGIAVGVIAAVTATFGNLAAYSQTNMKRMLAYSTIAHAGYMLMAIAAMMVLQSGRIGGDTSLAERSSHAVEGLLYYLAVYLFMNLGAFSITALIRNEIFSEEIEDYRGLGYQAPVLCVGMGLCLFSLVGLPPLGGFVGKLMIFASLLDAGYVHWSMWVILAIGGLNTVLSLFYYLNVLKTMYLTERPAGATTVTFPAWSSAGLYVMLVTVPIIVLGVHVQLVSNAARRAAEVLFLQ